MSYFGEFKSHWRAVLASALGMGAGLSINSYVTALFAPYLMQAFGWTKAQYALMGTTIMVTLFCLPIVGRLTDVFGVRRIAVVGAVSTPLAYITLSLFSGDIYDYLVIMILQVIFGSTTTATVYSRLVAERFVRARGLALAVVAGWPAAVGAIGIPLVTHVIETQGWRAGYRALAVYSLIVGSVALLLIPRTAVVSGGPVTTRQRARADYSALARNPTFWLIVAGVFLCNLPQTLNTMQFSVMLVDNGVTTAQAGMMLSVFAVGVVIGRFACGVALDRLPSHVVATITMGLPSIGLFIIASGLDTVSALSFAAVLLGLSMGAEGDVYAYLAVRHFGVQIYSSVLGLTTAVLGIATSLGSILLSMTLAWTNTFALFVMLSGIITVVGSALFMLLGRESVTRRAVDVRLGLTAPSAALNREST